MLAQCHPLLLPAWRGANEFYPIEQRLNSTVEPFDMYNCHSSYDPQTMAALARHSRYPLVHLHTIREPTEQFVSLYYHKNRGECGSGKLPTADDLQAFIDEKYNKYLPTFMSRMYDVSDFSANLAREECQFFDVIWQVKDLSNVLGKQPGDDMDKVNSSGKCPEKKKILEDEVLAGMIRRATAPYREVYEELLKCEKLRTDFPWVWDEQQSCIVTKEA